MKPVVIQSEAKLELAEGMAWYESRSPGVGLRLQAEVELAIARLQRRPDWSMPYKRTGFRKQTVNHFPYCVFFMELPDRLWVAAIGNMNRRPDYWRDRKWQSE